MLKDQQRIVIMNAQENGNHRSNLNNEGQPDPVEEGGDQINQDDVDANPFGWNGNVIIIIIISINDIDIHWQIDIVQDSGDSCQETTMWK